MISEISEYEVDYLPLFNASLFNFCLVYTLFPVIKQPQYEADNPPVFSATIPDPWKVPIREAGLSA